MSKILADLEEDDGSTIKINGKYKCYEVDVMIIKPNKALGQKAKYEEATVESYNQTNKITITNKNKAEQNGTLKEIKWITKDMIHLELIISSYAGMQVKDLQKSSS